MRVDRCAAICVSFSILRASTCINKTSHIKQVLMNYELYQLQPHLFCQSLKSAPGDSCQYSKATWRPARSPGKLVHMSQIVCAYTNLSLIGKLLHAQDEQSIATSPNSWYTWRPSAWWNYPCLKKKVFKLQTVYWEVHRTSRPPPAAQTAPWPPPGSTKTAVCRSCRPNLSKAEVQDLNISFFEAKACLS